METTQTQKIKAVAYCRVSNKTDESANSLSSQQEELAFELGDNPEIEYLGEYHDFGISGTKLNRTNFNRMLEDAGLQFQTHYNDEGDTRKNFIKYSFHARGDATQPKFNRIYVKDTSRFSRSLLVIDILNELYKKGVSVHFMDIGKRSDIPTDMIEINNHLLAAESESRLRSGKVLFGLKVSKRRNRVHSNTKLYGYKYSKEANSLTAIPEEAAIVRRIYQMYADGNGLRKIEKIFEDEKLKTRNGIKFSQNTISSILHNEKYAGMNNRLKLMKSSMLRNGASIKVRDNYDVVPNDRIDEIVPFELFEACQNMLSSKRSHNTLKGVFHGNSEYASLIICGSCGSTYHCNSYLDKRYNSKLRTVYNCSKAKKEGRKKDGDKGCDNPLILKEEIDNFIRGLEEGNLAIQMQYDMEQTISKLTNLKYTFMRKLTTDNNEQLLQLRNDIEQLHFEENNVRKSVRRFGTDKDFSELEEVLAELQQKQNAYDELNTPNVDIINRIKKIQFNIEHIKPYEGDYWLPNGDKYDERFFNKTQVLEYVEKIIVVKTGSTVKRRKNSATQVGVEYKMDTTKQYKQYIEAFGYDLDSLDSFSDEEKSTLEQKYLDEVKIAIV